MAAKKDLNEKQLLKMIEDGSAQPEIMAKFGFKTSTQLKVAYANALMKYGKVPELKKGRKAAKPKDVKVAVNKRGSLVIPKALIEKFGLAQGDTFKARKSTAGISLKKIS